MERLRYRELNSHERMKLCNGCGGKGGKVPLPSWLFQASCNQHDFYYWRGHTEDDRIKADGAFYKQMKKDAGLWPQRYIAAWFYYQGVRIFGGSFFRYGTRYMGRKDLNKLMKR